MNAEGSGLPSWSGADGDRRADIGRMTFYNLAGPAWHIAARLAEIIEANPGRVVEGTCLVHVMDALTDEEFDAQLQARAEAQVREDR